MVRNERARLWTAIAYPESLPKDWKDSLNQQGVPTVISPLHNKDTNDDGTLKKEHYHLLFVFDGKKSYNQVLTICESINATIPQIVQSAPAIVRYFSHKDNPEKYQYNEDDIQCLGGVDIDSYTKPAVTDVNQALSDIIEFIKDQEVTQVVDFTDYVRDHHLELWKDTFLLNNVLIANVIKSEWQKLQAIRNGTYIQPKWMRTSGNQNVTNNKQSSNKPTGGSSSD